MHIAPEGSPRRIGGPDRDHADAPPARPPQEQAGGDEDDGPAGDNLDDIVGPAAQQDQAVQLFDRLHHTAEAGGADQPGVIRIDEGRALVAVGQVDGQADGLVRPGREQDIGDLAPQAGLGRRNPEVRRGGPGARLDAGQVAIDGPVDLVGEQIEGAGQRHQHQEGQDQQAGVEMPAPDGAEGA